MKDHGVEIYSLYQAKFLDRVKELLEDWTWEQWCAADKETKDEVAAKAIADLLRQADQDDAWNLWDEWSENLGPEDFKQENQTMEKTLNQKIYEVPLDIKQAIYDRGYEAGRQSILEQEEARWIPAESSRYGSMYAGAKCSNCGGGVDGYVSIHFKFCPFCGKRMEEYKPYTAVAVGDKTTYADDTSIVYVGNGEVDDIQIYGYRAEEN